MRFFATKKDLLPLINDIESRFFAQYCKTGLFDSPDVVCYSSLAAVPDLGSAQKDVALSPRYLVLPANSHVQVRPIPQNSGGIKYGVDQLLNPDTIIIQPSGIYKEGILIEGSVSIAHQLDQAKSLNSLFRRRIAKLFLKLDYGCYVGPEATALLEQGWRFVQSADQPREYDQKTKPALNP